MALNIELPKWPAMTVLGDRVTPDQAAEIIIRTTEWLYGCNDRQWEKIVWDAIGAEVEVTNGYARATLDSLKAAKEKFRGLQLNYLYNSRVMSSWVGGPHGWCNWNGDIHSTNYNIGKWPRASEVRSEWAAIAETFPFLRLKCQLWSGETGDENNRPLVEYVVANGKVRMTAPKKPLLAPYYQPTSFDLGVDFRNSKRERGCDEATLRRAIQVTEDSGPRPSAWERLAEDRA